MTDSELQFTKLVKEHKSTIYTVCYMFSNDSDEVEDMFQESLINLWRGLKGFEGRTVPLTMDINLFDDHDTETQQVKLLRERIHQLQPFDRAIVLLWLENLSYDEIAAIVGISAKNVGVRLYRIKEQLKKS